MSTRSGVTIVYRCPLGYLEEGLVHITRMASVLTAVAAGIAGFVFAAPVVLAAPIRPLIGVPQPAHVVVVVMENHSYSEIIGSSSAQYINSLANGGRSSPSPSR